ncbi:hypothetical protein DdX_12676 [Ditylenchus destructor]|uniref:Uncharacterized protein n=1 Tax=Ditylenchus destructor TaxID=166010 RepID=A0AAD4MXW7_9BILA|nr:hypothetical protein DdX_12676 [Ditylenchus destructor]
MTRSRVKRVKRGYVSLWSRRESVQIACWDALPYTRECALEFANGEENGLPITFYSFSLTLSPHPMVFSDLHNLLLHYCRMESQGLLYAWPILEAAGLDVDGPSVPEVPGNPLGHTNIETNHKGGCMCPGVCLFWAKTAD